MLGSFSGAVFSQQPIVGRFSDEEVKPGEATGPRFQLIVMAQLRIKHPDVGQAPAGVFLGRRLLQLSQQMRATGTALLSQN